MSFVNTMKNRNKENYVKKSVSASKNCTYRPLNQRSGETCCTRRRSGEAGIKLIAGDHSHSLARLVAPDGEAEKRRSGEEENWRRGELEKRRSGHQVITPVAR